MPLSKRNPLRKMPRNIKAAYLRSLRRKLAKVNASEEIASKKMSDRTANLSEEGGGLLSEWENAYQQRKDIQERIAFARGKARKPR